MPDTIEPPTEASPLLPDPELETEAINDTPTSHHDHKVHSPRTIVLILSTTVLFGSICVSLSTVPFMRLLEDAICQKHYATSEIHESLCKIKPVQQELARLQGFIESAAAVVAILAAFPYGGLADKIGRRPVAMLYILGMVLNSSWQLIVLRFWHIIPLYTIIFSSFFLLIGGGDIIGSAVLWTIFADVTDENTRASAFFTGGLAALTGELIGPLLATKLMTWATPWLPLLVALATLPLTAALILLIPETLKLPSKNNNACSTSPSDPAPESTPPPFSKPNKTTLLNRALKTALSTLTHTLTLLIQNPSIPLLLPTFLIHRSIQLARSTYLAQYTSLRFHWTLASTGYLLSLRGGIEMLLFGLLLPLLSSHLTSRYKFTAARKDYLLLITSFFLLLTSTILLSLPLLGFVVLGVITISLAAGTWVFARSLLTGYVTQENRSKLYAFIGIVEAIGGLYAGPVWAVVLGWGLERGGGWVGAPWLWLGGCVVLVGFAVGFVDVRKGKKGDEEEEGVGSVGGEVEP